MIAMEEEIAAYFRSAPAVDYWGTTIDEKHVRDYFHASATRFAIVTDYAKSIGGKRVAEVGPAYGAISLQLQRAGMDVTAYEMPEGIGAYTAVMQARGVPVVPWDIHLSDQRGSFDLVIASEVIEHLQISIPAAVRKLSMLLAPGGRLIVTVPNALNLPNLVRIMRGRNIQEPFEDQASIRNGVVIDSRVHPREPVMSEMLDAVRAAGLAVRYSDYFNTMPRPRLRNLAYILSPKCWRDHILIDAQSRL